MEALVVLLIYGLIGAAFVTLAVLFWLRSYGSRRTRKCPQCGEEVTTELMESKRCNTCGAAL